MNKTEGNLENQAAMARSLLLPVAVVPLKLETGLNQFQLLNCLL